MLILPKLPEAPVNTDGFPRGSSALSGLGSLGFFGDSPDSAIPDSEITNSSDGGGIGASAAKALTTIFGPVFSAFRIGGDSVAASNTYGSVATALVAEDAARARSKAWAYGGGIAAIALLGGLGIYFATRKG